MYWEWKKACLGVLDLFGNSMLSCGLERIFWVTLQDSMETQSVFRKPAFHLNLKGPWENLGWTCNITPREQGMSLGMGLEQALGMCVGLIDVPRPYGAYGQAQSVWAMVSTCQQWEQKAEFRGVRIAHGSLPVQHWKSAQILLNFFFLMAFLDTTITFQWAGEEAGRGSWCCRSICLSPLLPETAWSPRHFSQHLALSVDVSWYPVKGLIHLNGVVSEHAKFLWCLLDKYQLLEALLTLKIDNTFLNKFILKTGR